MTTITELRFAAMGTEAHVIVVGGPDGLMDVAARRIAELEQRWSRFLPSSELSRINERAGRPVAVSNDTFLLVSRSIDAWRATGGAFDPTVLASMRAIGYDRTFAEITDGPIGSLAPAPGCADIVLDAQLRSVKLPEGVGIDAGGIGKGLAADLVVSELMAQGAQGACVNMGGDLRVEGESPTGEGWPLAIADPYNTDRYIAVVGVDSGALVTSTSLMRAWQRDGQTMHHLINPQTGAPCDSDLVSVTMITQEAWWGEALAKASLIVGGEVAQQLAAATGLTGVLVAGPDRWLKLPGLEVFAALSA